MLRTNDRFICLAALLVAALAACPAFYAAAPDNWAPYRFLVGNWVGEEGGGGQPGQASGGGFSLRFDLDEKVLVRKSNASYPATKDRPAFTHEDLTIIYPQAGRSGARAIYFDNEGHVIEYAVEAPAEGKLVLTSEAAPSVPRYRLTYTKLGADRVSIKFEIAPPGKPDAFAMYVESAARRTGP
jgi:hypothetical protein